MPEDGISMWNVNLSHGRVPKQIVYPRGMETLLVRYTFGQIEGSPLYIYIYIVSQKKEFFKCDLYLLEVQVDKTKVQDMLNDY